MSNTSIPVDIATALKAALVAVVPSGTNVFAAGVQDTSGVNKDPLLPPLVAIVVHTCQPLQYRSVLREYVVDISAVTAFQEDRFQTELYAIEAVVSAWLCEPSLTLTLAHYDSLTIESVEGPIIDPLQQFSWQCKVHTRKLTS